MPTSAATGTKQVQTAGAKSSDDPKNKSVEAKRHPKSDDRKRRPAATAGKRYSAKDFDRAKSRMGGIDPDAVAECKTVEDLDALHLKARGTRIPGLNQPALADQSGNGSVQSTKADGSIVNYDASEDGWEDAAFGGTSKQVSATD